MPLQFESCRTSQSSGLNENMNIDLLTTLILQLPLPKKCKSLLLLRHYVFQSPMYCVLINIINSYKIGTSVARVDCSCLVIQITKFNKKKRENNFFYVTLIFMVISMARQRQLDKPRHILQY